MVFPEIIMPKNAHSRSSSFQYAKHTIPFLNIIFHFFAFTLSAGFQIFIHHKFLFDLDFAEFALDARRN